MIHPKTLLETMGVYKSFGITKALKGVKLELMEGEVLGLIGENGSGKSTLALIIAGILEADSAKMNLGGKLHAPKSSVEGNEAGICMILQEKGTFDHLSVAYNIFIGVEKPFLKRGILDVRSMNKEAEKALKKIGASHISPSSSIASLSFEDCKLVELARAVTLNPKILIIDETTTALSRKGRDILYEIMENMKENKKSVIFISHDIDEMMDKCDRLSILRDGDYVDTLNKEEFSAQKIRKLMVGRDISDNYYRNDLDSTTQDEVVMEVENVIAGKLKNISFKLKKGEILGFGGLADCGMHDLGKLAFGLLEYRDGIVKYADGEKIKHPAQAMERKVGYIGKNRDQEALMTASPILDNICIASHKSLSKFGCILPSWEKKFVDYWADQLEIKMRSSKQYVMELSGGNKQKVAIAKWLGFGADIFVLDCPTRGIDIGVKANIYKLMMDLKKKGKSIILISEELPEIIGMSDRVMILKDGEVTGEFAREDNLSESMLIEYMV